MPPWVLPWCKTKQHWPLYVALREKQTTTWEQQASSARNINQKVVCQHALKKKKKSWVELWLHWDWLIYYSKGLKMDLKTQKKNIQNYDPTCCLHLAHWLLLNMYDSWLLINATMQCSPAGKDRQRQLRVSRWLLCLNKKQSAKTAWIRGDTMRTSWVHLGNGGRKKEAPRQRNWA